MKTAMITGLLDKFVREHGDYGYLTEEDCVELNYRSPCGRDFWAAIPFAETENAKNTFLGFVRNLDIYCDNFDESRETYIWLDEEGHGRRGAPYDLRAVLDDTKRCWDAMCDLYDFLVGYA